MNLFLEKCTSYLALRLLTDGAANPFIWLIGWCDNPLVVTM